MCLWPWRIATYLQNHWLQWQLLPARLPLSQLAPWLNSCCSHPGDREVAGLPSVSAGTERQTTKKPRKLLTCLEKKKNTEKKKRVREKVTENCCIEVIRLIKWQTKNWILVIKCITPFAFFIQAQNEPQLWANRLKPKLKSVRTSWILKHISSLHH